MKNKFVGFEDLPFSERPDLTPYILHLTKNTENDDEYSAYDNLISILRKGIIWGSKPSKGFIKGKSHATCFMDIPFPALKYVLNNVNSDPNKPKYGPFGIVFSKKYAYKHGCRPVMYLSDQELKTLGIPQSELWRVVKFDIKGKAWVIWIHEREWRCRGDFDLPSNPITVLVKKSSFTRRLQKDIAANKNEYKSIPQIIIPL